MLSSLETPVLSDALKSSILLCPALTADLINASSKSLETLNKIVIQNKRSETTLVAKKMDVDSKQVIEEKRNENALIASRDEVFKKILDDAKVIDVKEEDV